MPILTKDGLLPADVWQRDPTKAQGASHLLLAYAAFEEEVKKGGEANQKLGVELPNTAKITTLLPWLDRLELVTIAFPNFTDGRGFSLARALRQAGYRQRLRAFGALIPDQFGYALGCGFDEVEITQETLARQPLSQWLADLAGFQAHYQRGYAGGGYEAGVTILDRRAAARQVLTLRQVPSLEEKALDERFRKGG